MAKVPKAILLILFMATSAVGIGSIRQAKAQTMIACADAYEGGKRSDFFNTPVYQGKDGWFFRYAADLSDTQVISPDAVAKVAKISRILARRGTRLVYMPIPTRGLAGEQFLPSEVSDGVVYDPDLALKSHQGHVDAMRKAGVLSIDLATALKETPPQEHVFLSRDFHWTPEGARWVALQARKTFDGEASYGELPKIKFETVGTGSQTYTSKMYDALADVCGSSDNISETVNGYETKRIGATADDLLGGEGSDIAGIALIGTSFSDKEIFNFEGFLSQYLESEVANFAITGGGQFTALYKWSLTEAQKTDLPKFLLWELPIYDRLDDSQYIIIFRQIIAAVQGPCTNDNLSIPSQAVNLLADEAKRIELPADKKLQGEDVALRFKADGQNLPGLGLELEYENGEVELLNLHQPERIGAMGTVQIALNDEMHSPLTALTVRSLKRTPLNLSVDICSFQGVGQ